MKREFRISGGSAESKKNYFISIDDDAFGEAVWSVRSGLDNPQIKNDLELAIEQLKSIRTVSLATLHLIDSLEINSAAKMGLIGAALHKLSAINEMYPWQILKLEEPTDIHTSFTVSLDNPEAMLREISDSAYPIIKIKMGGEDDDALLAGLKNVSGKILRIDANGGWTPEQAERMIYFLDKLEVQFVEQPTMVDYIGEWKHIRGRTRMKLFIDEGLNCLEDYERYAEFVDGINIKMAKSGGILEAKKIAEAAGRDKKEIMLGCMIESSIGLSQAVYMSSVADYFDLDSPLLLKEDIATGLNFDNEKITVDDSIMGGPKIKEEYLDK